MAFVCPKKCETEKRTKLLSELKSIIQSVEEKLAVTAEPTYCVTPCCMPCCSPCAPCCPPCAPCCPPCAPRSPPCAPCCPPCAPCCPPCAPCCPPCCCQQQQQEEKVCEIPDTMVCYRVSCKNKNGNGKSRSDGTTGSSGAKVKRSSSRELRASILYVGCDCEKRNGLQDDCPRSDCQGAPPCLTKPPTCGPSEFCDGKHLGKRSTTASSKGGNGNNKDAYEDGLADNVEANYVCFPAKINPPKMCIPTCFMPIDCCPACPGQQ